MIRTFGLQLFAWSAGLAVVHSGLRVLTGTVEARPFLADLTSFGLITLAIGALPAGIIASRNLVLDAPATLRRVIGLAGVASALAVAAYLTLDRVAPALWVADANAVGESVEPRGLTSTQLRAAASSAIEDARARDRAGEPSVDAWQTVNRIAFEHELRIVQALLIPIMGLIGLLAGAQARGLSRDWQPPALWGLGLFLVLALFMAGENGYELIVLRSSGPMAFVAWLQAVVPGSVLVGLSFAALPDLLRATPPPQYE